MKAEHIFIALEVAESGSFSAASKKLFITQPNISYAVKQLEIEVGFPIFERVHGGVIPTKKGITVLDQFRRIKREYDRIGMMLESMSLSEGIEDMPLRVVTLNCSRLHPLISDFICENINNKAYCSVTRAARIFDVEEAITHSEADVAFIGTLSTFLDQAKKRVANSGLEYRVLTRTGISLLARKDHPVLGDMDQIDMVDIKGFPMIYCGDPNNPLQSIPVVSGLADHAKKLMRVDDPPLMLDIISRTDTVAVVATNPFFTSDKIKRIPVTGTDLYAEYAWMKLRQTDLSEMAVALVYKVEKFMHEGYSGYTDGY